MNEESTERIISEDEIPLILREYNTIALEHINANEYENALEALSHSEEILETIKAQGGFINREFIL